GSDDIDSGTLKFTLAVAAAPSNDACAAATVIATAPFTTTLDTSEATTAPDDPPPSCIVEPNSASVWYEFTPASTGTITVDTFGSDYDTVLTAHLGGCGDLAEVACND